MYLGFCKASLLFQGNLKPKGYNQIELEVPRKLSP